MTYIHISILPFEAHDKDQPKTILVAVYTRSYLLYGWYSNFQTVVFMLAARTLMLVNKESMASRLRWVANCPEAKNLLQEETHSKSTTEQC